MIGRYYSILGLEFGADKASVKVAFRRLAAIFHPDKDENSRQRFNEICEAYDALMRREKTLSKVDLTYDLKTNLNASNQAWAQSSTQERRHVRRGSPGDRRFECIQEAQYKGVHLKVRS